ncbi:MAG: aldo/keto reductase [Pseudomonadota bacterium]
MDRIALSSELSISRLAYGMWRIGDDKDTSPAYIQAKIEACLETGITTLDQADIYGAYGAEALLGAALKDSPGLRDQVEIVTKCGIIAPMGRYAEKSVKYYDTGRTHIHQSVDLSLQLMGLEQIDLLLIHRPDPMMDHHETGDALDQLVGSGKVKAVGVSNFKPHDWDLLQSAMTTRLVTNQIEISVMAIDAFTNGDLAHLQRLGIPAMAWSPLGGGALFGTSAHAVATTLNKIAERLGTDIASLAYAWLLAHPANIAPVIGTNSIERIKALRSVSDIRLDRETWFEIYSAALGQDVP